MKTSMLPPAWKRTSHQAVSRRGLEARAACARASVFGILSAFFITHASFPTFGWAAEKSAEELITPNTKASIDKGLRWLAGRQIKRGQDAGAFGAASYAGSPGICGLAGLAFMFDGNTPGIGRYGAEVQRCVDFVNRNCDATSGYIARKGDETGNMYSHGFAMLFLTQALGMTQDEKTAESLRRAINMLVEAQNEQGGWRYQPRKSDADLSLTVCQIMALRGARDAGLDVPEKTRQKCIEYVKKSNNRNGSFSYTLGFGGGGSFALTAAGIVSLNSAGIYKGPIIDNGLAFLEKQGTGRGGGYYFYGNYYAVQAFWHVGGERWENWYTKIRDELLASQSPDGSWNIDRYGPEFGTAMALIILQMPKDIVPVFSR